MEIIAVSRIIVSCLLPVQREVTDAIVISELNRKSASTVPGAVKVPDVSPASKPSSRYGFKSRLYQPRVQEPKPEPKKPVLSKRPGTVAAAVGSKDGGQARLTRPQCKVCTCLVLSAFSQTCF